MEPAALFASREAMKAEGALYRILEIVEGEVAKLKEEIGNNDHHEKTPGYIAERLDFVARDLETARTEASRWTFMDQVAHAR
jgi:hypothetical protein